MPRLPKSKEDKQRQAIVNAVDLYMIGKTRSGVDARTAAAAFGFSYSTLLNRRKNPGNFTLREIQSIANVLNVSVPTLLGGGENHE